MDNNYTLIDVKKYAKLLANIDHLHCIALLQKHNLYTLNIANPLPSDVISFIDTITLDDANELHILGFEMYNSYTYYFNLLAQKNYRNYEIFKIKKKIQDYTAAINELNGNVVDFKTQITKLDPQLDQKKFEMFTAQWADAQDKIGRLRSDIATFQAQLNPDT